MGRKKEHYFELVMNSVSEGELNQEVVVVREYANTPSELVIKQMMFCKSAVVPIIEAVLKAMDEQSMPIQKIGMKELEAAFAEFAEGGKPADKPKKNAR